MELFQQIPFLLMTTIEIVISTVVERGQLVDRVATWFSVRIAEPPDYGCPLCDTVELVEVGRLRSVDGLDPGRDR